MARGLRQMLAALVGAALLPAATGAGVYSPPPGDSTPVWSPDGSVIVYATRREPGGLHVVRPDGSDDHPLPGLAAYYPFAFSPDWFWLAYVAPDPVTLSQTALWVARPDSTGRRVLSDSAGGTLSWSPDGTRIAFTRNPYDTGPPDVHTIRVDGTDRRLLAEDGFDPRWSPDGSRIAYVVIGRSPERWDVAVVSADGSGRVNLTAALRSQVHSLPTWSPDGSRLAFVARGFLGVVRPDGTGLRRYALAGQPGFLDWSPDGRLLLISGAAYSFTSPMGTGVFVLDVGTGRQRVLAPFGTFATWSPDGSQIAFAGGGECKDRSGVYRMRANGTALQRITNDCRIVGTTGVDALVGTFLADVLVGRAGDDRLTANDANYMGDDLYGGEGDDVLTGGYLGDVLDGGPGADRLDGAAGPDAIRGGAGRDSIDGMGGRDVILAEDGERDTVSCGTNPPSGGRDLDTAFLDRLDRVTPDCELLYRAGRADLTRGPTSLTIRVPTGRRNEQPRRWTLRCNPTRGTLPNAAEACRRLATMRAPLAPLPPGTLCAATAEPYRSASVRGVFGGRSVSLLFSRYTRCELARWNRHRFLIEPR